ncbi:unnamed protein product [Amoebophrya sp. A120]|nr:unnamed protein product [Amoebophrya sp. A120]|eukprot:GSA120T00015385001.1
MGRRRCSVSRNLSNFCIFNLREGEHLERSSKSKHKKGPSQQDIWAGEK